jgi:hypothetical protein
MWKCENVINVKMRLLRQSFSHFHISTFPNYSARALGFEPRSKVLETRMLPLHHARIFPDPYPANSGTMPVRKLKAISGWPIAFSIII